MDAYRIAGLKTELVNRGSVVRSSKRDTPKSLGPHIDDLSDAQKNILVGYLSSQGSSWRDYKLADTEDGLVFSHREDGSSFALRTQDRFGQRYADPSACPSLLDKGYSRPVPLDEGLVVFAQSGDRR